MSAIAEARQRLKELEKAAHDAERAVEKAEGAGYALQDREEKRRQRSWAGDSDEDEDEDEDEDAMSDTEAQKEKAEEFPDEEADDFDFEAKEKRLEQELLRCKIKAVEAYETFVTEFEKCVKADAKGPLTQLHDKIQAKLPLELREMIYSYLGVKARAHANNPMKHFPIYVGRGGFDPYFHHGEELKVDDDFKDFQRVFEVGSFDSLQPGGWLLNPEYVGPAMAREIAELFYSINDFSMEARELEEFLCTDRTQTGFKPYEFIRQKMDIGVATTMCNGDMESAWRTTENEIEFLNKIYKNLSCLMLITHKSELSVEIHLNTSAPMWEEPEVGERRFYNIMESVRAPIYDLIHAGIPTTVIHTRKGNGRKRNISTEPLNYFRMSKEEWAAEKEGHGPDWVPSNNFITKEELEDPDKKRREATKRRLKELLKKRWDHEESIDA